MEVLVFNWMSLNTYDELIGYKHNNFVNEDVFDVAKKILDKGFDVMIRKYDYDKYTVYFDTKLFTQR